VQAGLGIAAGPRASSSGDASAGAANNSGTNVVKNDPPASRPPEPPPVITAGDGAQSVEAVVKQMQSAAQSGKGAQILSVIYPTERPTYAQGVAMAIVFLPMASLSNEKEADRITKEADAFFAKHQIKPPFSREPAELFKGVDLAAFVSDAMVFMKGHAKKGDNPDGRAAGSIRVAREREDHRRRGGRDAEREGRQVHESEQPLVHQTRVTRHS
jgi:hypothetical protein